MTSVSVKHFTNYNQSEFETTLTFNEQYHLVDQLFMLIVHTKPKLALQIQPGIDARATAWRQYDYIRRMARENGVL